MDKLFGIDISKKAENDLDLENEEQVSVRRDYREPMSEVNTEDEFEEDVQVDVDTTAPEKRPSKPSHIHSENVPDLDVDYNKENQKHHDDKEIF